MRRVLGVVVPPVLWAAAIWIVGGLQDTPSAPSVPGLDKIAHFGMYGGLGFLLGRSWVLIGRGWTWVLPLAVALALGAADERRQGALPTRSSELADWLADAAGASLGFALGVARTRRKKTNQDR